MQEGIILINKEKGLTSRDVVNQVSKDKMVLSINHYGELLSSSKVINLER